MGRRARAAIKDQRLYRDDVALHRMLAAHHIPHWFAAYPGGHSLSLWAQWAPLWLGRALAYLKPA